MLTGLDDSRHLTAELRLQFSKAVEASNRAVMADNNEASVAMAREAEKSLKAVEQGVAKLSPLLRALGFERELGILNEFGTHFSEYQKLDSRILGLAVENTNLKAQALSFGPASLAAATFRDSLAPVAAGSKAKDRGRSEALIAQALLAVREIQVLHAPHIAEHDDASMTRMEKEMADLDAKAQGAIKALEELAAPDARPAIASARAELDQFRAINAQIVELSRRNTDVVSLNLALHKRPTLSGACDERLWALQDALAKQDIPARR